MADEMVKRWCCTMNDGEKLVRMYSDDKNMVKRKYHENKEMVSMMVIVTRT